ncbi:MAG TPA: co-chaperone GroES [Thermoanaerobaculia bacterium]
MTPGESSDLLRTQPKVKPNRARVRRRNVNIRPLHDRVVVKRMELQEQIRGGIIIPDSAKEKPQEAEVIAVGPGKLNDDGKRSPMDVKAGDRVLMGKYSGSEIKIDDEDYVILREDEILAVVDGKK